MIANKRQRARLIKLQDAQTRKHLRDNYSVYEPAMCGNFVKIFTPKLEEIGISKRLADSIAKIEIKWTITCYLLLRSRKGKDSLISTAIDINTPCKHSEIRGKIADAQWEWIKEYPYQDNILTTAWIATMQGYEPDSDVAHEIFDKLGCWKELIAGWQE